MITSVQILSLLDQGLVDYSQVDALQRSLHEDVLAGGEDTLIVSQFTPTWTGRPQASRTVSMTEASTARIHCTRSTGSFRRTTG